MSEVIPPPQYPSDAELDAAAAAVDAPPATPTERDLDAIVAWTSKQQDAEKVQRLGALFKASQFKDGTQQAKVLEVSRRLGVKPEIAEANIAGFSKAAEAAGFDPQLFYEKNPILADIVLNRPEVAPVIFERTELDLIQRLVSRLRELGSHFSATVAAQEGMPWEGQEEAVKEATDYSKALEQARANGYMQARQWGQPELKGLDWLTGAQFQWIDTPNVVLGPRRIPIPTQPPPWALTLASAWDRSIVRASLGAAILAKKAWSTDPRGADTYDLEKQVIELEQQPPPPHYGGPVQRAILSGVEFVPFMTVAGLGTALAGPIGGFATNFTLLTGGSFLDLREQPLENGERMDDATAGAAAVLFGTLAAASMTKAFPHILRQWGSLGDVIAAGNAKGFTQRLMRDATFANLLKRYGQDMLHSANHTARQMALQSFLGDATTYVARSAAAHGGALQDWSGPDVLGMAERAAESGWQAWMGSLAVGLPASAMRFSGELSRLGDTLMEDAAVRGRGKVRAILDYVRTGKAVAAIPESLARKMQEAAAESGVPVDKLWLDPRALPRIFLQQDWEPAARELGGDKLVTDIHAALATGDKVPIRLDDFMARWATKRDLVERLAEHLAAASYFETDFQRAERVGKDFADAVRLSRDLGNVPAESEAEESLIRTVTEGMRALGSPEDAPQVVALWRAMVRTKVARWNADVRIGPRIAADQLFAEAEVQFRRALENEVSPAAAAQPQAETLREGKETLEPYGIQPGKKHNLFDIAIALTKRTREKYGTIERKDFSDDAARKLGLGLVDEIASLIDAVPEARRNGRDWYSGSWNEAVEIVGQRMHPQLLTDANERGIFTLISALTSNGEKVWKNFQTALDVYASRGKAGEFVTPPTYRPQVGQHVDLLNELLAQYGPEKLLQRLLTPVTVSQGKKMARDETVKFRPAGKYPAEEVVPYASIVFGDKVGIFFANLMGQHQYLTIDMWNVRSLSRMRGTLLKEPTRKSLQQLKEMLGNPEMDDGEALLNAAWIGKEVADRNFKNPPPTDLERKANQIAEVGLKEIDSAPLGAGDRGLSLRAYRIALDELKKRGIDLQMDEAQAVQWYFEKLLWRELGAREDAPYGYGDIARRVVAARLAGVKYVPGEREIIGPDGAAIDIPTSDARRAARVAMQEDIPPVPGLVTAAESREIADVAREARAAALPTLEKLLERVRQPDGGFTYRMQTDEEPKAGYVLSIHPDRSKAFDAAALSFQALVDYAVANADLLDQPGKHLGAWHDPASGKVFLDVSQVTQDAGEARALALKHDQIAYYDLNKGVSVTVNAAATSGGAARAAEAQPQPREALQPVAGGAGGGPGAAVPPAHGEGALTAGTPGRPSAVAVYEQGGWHGSPHRFTGEFSLNYVGTGEGHSMVAFGHYFGERRETGEYYRYGLTSVKAVLRGTDISPLGAGTPPEILGRAHIGERMGRIPAGELAGEQRRWAGSYAQEMLSAILRGSPSYVVEKITPEELLSLGRLKLEEEIRRIGNALKTGKQDPQYRATAALTLQHNERALEILKQAKPENVEIDRGALYHVQIPEKSELLDWEKPFTEQPPGVVEKLKAAGIIKIVPRPESWTVKRETQAIEVPNGERLAFSETNFGRKLYDALKETNWAGRYEGRGGPEQKASDALREAGIPGVKYLDQGSRFATQGTAEPTHDFVIWDDSRIKVLERHFQGGPEKVTRGWMANLSEGVRRIYEVAVTKHANLTTLAHESSHVFLELAKSLAERPDAPKAIKQEWRDTEKWLGLAEGADLTTAAQEKWARTFEAYLREGKAPSASLVRPFQRFRIWLSSIYASAEGVPGAQLDPEVRGIFDRMLATDREIELQARASAIHMPIAKTAKDAGMSDDEFAAYLESQKRAMTHAAEVANRRTLKDQLRETEAWWRDEVKKLRPEVEKAYDEQPAVLAWNLLRNGKAGVTALEPFTGKINRLSMLRELKNMAPEERELAMKKLSGRIAADGEVMPGEIASVLGFKSVEEMVRAISATPAREEWVRSRIGFTMADRHGDISLEREKLRKLVGDSLHDEVGLDWLFREYAALRKRVEGAPAPAIEAMDLAARQIVRRMSVDDLDVTKIQATEKKRAEEAFQAVGAGEFRRALVAKQQQLVAALTYRYASDAKEAYDGFQKLLARLTDDKVRGQIGLAVPEALDGIDAVTEATGAKDHPSVEELARRMPFDSVLSVMAKEGIPAAFDVETVRQFLAEGQQYWPGRKDLTVEQMLDADAALRQLSKWASVTRSVQMIDKEMDRDALVADIASEAATANAERRPAPASETAAPQSWWWRQRLQGVGAELTDPQLIFELLGPTANKFFWGGYIRSRNAESALQKGVTDKVMKLWEHVPKQERGRRWELLPDNVLPLPEDVSKDISARDRVWLLMVALNFGNASNKERLLGGYGWSEAQVIDALQNYLSHGEMEFAQKVWDLLSADLYPAVEATYKAMHGIAPKKIEATPLTLTIDGETRTYRGGYFPARYDPVAARSPVGVRQEDAAINQLFGGQSVPTSVERYFVQERAKHFEDVINLQWSVVPSHILDVIHYTTHAQFVGDAYRVLKTPEMKDAVNRYLGLKYMPQLDQWLKVVASSRAEEAPRYLQDTLSMASAGRSRFSMAVLGANLAIMANDISQPIDAVMMKEIDAGHAFTSIMLANTGAGFYAMRKRALELSGEMRVRADTSERWLREGLAEIAGRRGKRGPAGRALDFVREAAFWGYDVVSRVTSTVVWDAKFRQEMAEHGDQARAVEAADTTIQHVFPSGRAAEQPSILRSKNGIGQMLIFYSFFNKRFNTMRRLWHPVIADYQRADGVGEKLSTLPSMAATAGHALGLLLSFGAFSEILNGRGPMQDEDWADYLARKTVASTFLMLPFGGEVGGLIEYNMAPEGSMRKPSERTAPFLSAVLRIADALQTVKDSNKTDADRYLAAMELIAFGAKLPVSAPKRATKYLLEPSDTTAAGIASGLVYGERENQPTNAFTVWRR